MPTTPRSKMPPSTLYALLLALVLGVGCGKEAVKTSPKEPEAKTQKADTKKKVPAACPFCGGKFPISDIAFHKLKCPQNTNDQRMNKPASGKPTEEAKNLELPKATSEKLITDPIVEKAIRKSLKKPTGELTEADLEKVKMLNLRNNQLTDVKGLEKFTHLTLLSLNGNNLTDVKVLENLKSLKVLYLLDNKLTDVKGLEKLTQLKQLFLNNNPDLTKAQIDELQKALPKCTIEHNTKLDTPKFAKVIEDAIGMRLNKPRILKATGEITRGEITEADLEKVKMLNLGGNQLTSVKGLEQLTQLTKLFLHDNQLTDVKGLEKLKQLTFLRLEGNKLSDVKGLEKLAELTMLRLHNNPDLTKAQIAELQKALPNCKIISNPTK